MHPELDPATYGLTIWDLDREFITGGLAGKDTMTLGEILGRPARHLLRHDRRRVHAHRRTPRSSGGSRSREGRAAPLARRDERAILLEQLNEAEAFERFLATKYVGHKRFSLEGAESLIPILDAICRPRGRRGRRRGPSSAWPTAGG